MIIITAKQPARLVVKNLDFFAPAAAQPLEAALSYRHAWRMARSLNGSPSLLNALRHEMHDAAVRAKNRACVEARLNASRRNRAA